MLPIWVIRRLGSLPYESDTSMLRTLVWLLSGDLGMRIWAKTTRGDRGASPCPALEQIGLSEYRIGGNNLKIGHSARLMAASFALASCGLAAGAAQASDPLGFSFAATGVGSCVIGAPCGGASVTYSPGSQTSALGFGANASSTASDPLWGLAHGSANQGVGLIALPELHSDTSGLPAHGGSFALAYSLVQGAERFQWLGGDMVLDASDFIGTLDYQASNNGFSEISASLAILTGAVQHNALGDAWFLGDGSYGFLNDCSSEGAVAIGETGFFQVSGNGSRSVASTSCGAFTLHNGDYFSLWARMETVHADAGFTDASHTFAVSLSPDLSPETAAFLANNIVAQSDFGAVPEPASWALIIAGFGMVGAALRRRTAAVAA